jgi:hypothetical protein
MRTTLLVALAIVAVPSTALAQTGTKKSESVETYVFPDDKLLSPLGGDHGLIITGPPKPVRILLTRPRVHFVPELLKSIEAI